jgi:outer membrane protein assembly factor BamA
LTAGFSLSDLQMQYPDLHNANANAVVASLNFQNVWGNTGDDRHSLQAGYDFRAGNHRLDSDFIYTRHSVQAQYAYDHNRNRLLVKFAAGTIAGNAPLLERFSLGDTSTLRGWNKFDVAPLGGNRMIHATLQYGIRGPHIGAGRIQIDPQPKRQLDIRLGLHVFYDVGAVGDRGSPIKARHSVGFGIGPVSSGFFLQLGFPIRSERVAPIFITGFRF